MYLNIEARNKSIIGAKNAIKTQQITLKHLKNKTNIDKNDVLTILSDSQRFVDAILYFKHRFWPKIANLTPKTDRITPPSYCFSAL